MWPNVLQSHQVQTYMARGSDCLNFICSKKLFDNVYSLLRVWGKKESSFNSMKPCFAFLGKRVFCPVSTVHDWPLSLFSPSWSTTKFPVIVNFAIYSSRVSLHDSHFSLHDPWWQINNRILSLTWQGAVRQKLFFLNRNSRTRFHLEKSYPRLSWASGSITAGVNAFFKVSYPEHNLMLYHTQ